MKYWAVGSSFGGTDDKTNEFIKNKNWYDGRYESGDFQNIKYLEKVKLNDVLVMKSSSTKGKGHKITFTKVKGIGIVTSIIDIHHYKIQWLNSKEFPIDFDGVSYRKVIEPLRLDSISDYVSKLLNKLNMENKIKLLTNKKQIILQGPPGTGKTRLAKLIAKEICENDKYISIIQFHPSYTYEDFVRGITVKSGEDGLEYLTEDKVLAKIANKAFLSQQKIISNEDLLNEYCTYLMSKEGNEEKYFFDRDSKIRFLDIYYPDKTYLRYELFNGKKWVMQTWVDLKELLDDDYRKQKDNNELEIIFKHLLNFKKEIPIQNYVLIIDEINRANLSSVLGELIYALEYRGEPVESMYALEDGGNTIILPDNLYIIGTMNTADRSVGQIDYAIRRRFAFVDILPEVLDENDLKDGLKFNTTLFNKVATLFDDNENRYLSEEFKAKDVQLGHSYFIHKEGEFKLKLEYEIKPILREYVQDGILKENALDIIDNL